MVETITAAASPALDHIIERPRLIARIVEGDARVTVFAAPAGYGKTTLARQWGERQTGPVVWYRTTRASGDVASLAVGMDEVLASIAPPDLPRDPGRVARIASVNPSPRPLGRALVRTYEPLTRDVLLIVDEWEAAETDEAEQLLSTLVDELDIRFLITSRTRPEWFTPRLEVYGEGLEIGVDELTMTEEETTEVLTHAKRGSQIETAHLGGWPAAIGFVTIQETTEAPRRTHPRILYNFLATEVLGAAPPEITQDLTVLALAAADKRHIAHTLLGHRADARLGDAELLGLLRLGEDGSVLLHPLLRDHLSSLPRTGADRKLLSKKLAPLVEARQWEHALAAAEGLAEPDFVLQALSRALPDLLVTGRVGTLRRWLGACEAAGADSPVVTYARAELAFRDADFDRAIALAELATEGLSGDTRANAHLSAARAANLAEHGTIAERHAIAAKQAAASTETRSAAAWALFLQALEDESEDCECRLQDYSEAARYGELRLIRMAHGRICLGLLAADLEGALDDAGVVRTLLRPEVDPLARSSFLNMFATGTATAARYQDSLSAALQELAIAEECDFEFVRRHGMLARARALIGLRDLTPAEKALRDVERRLQASPDAFLDVSCAIERARLYITLGDLDRAYSALAPDVARRLGRGAHGEYLALRALVLASAGRATDALSAASRARSRSRAVPTRCLCALATVIATPTKVAKQDAQAIFVEAMELGGADAVVLACRASRTFAEQVAESADTRSELIRLFVESHDYTLARRLGARAPRSVRRAAELSPREAEIHQLIAQGLTNPEISRLLFISPSTTKVHVRHILEKLGVRSRVEAARVWEPDPPT